MPSRAYRLGIGCVLLASCAFGPRVSAQPGGSGGPPKATVRVAPVQMRPVERRADATGRLRALREAQVATRESGRVREVNVRQGDLVQPGDVLVVLDDALLSPESAAARAEAARSRALLAEREADLQKAERDFSRITDLSARGSASEFEILDAQTQVDRAKARRDQARAESDASHARSDLLDRRLEDLIVRAPFAGQVVERAVDEGEWADRGGAVARVLDLDRLEAWIDVPERHLPSITPGSTVLAISVPATGSTIDAPADAILSAGDAATRTFPVRATLENQQGALRPGMTITASVPTGELAPSLLVPADALLRDDAGWFVYTATGSDPDNRAAVPARVERLFSVGALTAVRTISGPLFPGAIVVIEGNERILFPGQPLTVANPDVLSATQPHSQDNN